MDNPYIPNTSAIPNIIFDYWMFHLSPAEFKVLMCIARKTYGWHKTIDRISIKQLEKMTGLHRSGIIKNLHNLIEIGLINKTKNKTPDGDDGPNEYEINVYCVGGGSALNRPGVVDSIDHGVVDSVDPQKKDYTKERLTKEYTPQSPHKISSKKQDSANAECVGVSSPPSKKDIKKSYGDDGTVKLTEQQYDDLLKVMTPKERDSWIQDVSLDIAKKGEANFNKKYKSHYHTILSWKRFREQKLGAAGKDNSKIAKHRQGSMMVIPGDYEDFNDEITKL